MSLITDAVMAAGKKINGAGGVAAGASGTVKAAANRIAGPTNSGRYAAPSGPPGAQAGPISGPGGNGSAPDLNTFLNQDSGYQQQMSEFGNALQQFLADITRRKGSLQTDYDSSVKAMGDQKVLDLKGLEDSYGSRGIIHSGLYGKAVGDYNNEFDTRSQQLAKGETDALSGLDQQQGQFQSQQQLQQEAARQAAIRRRADTYGV